MYARVEDGQVQEVGELPEVGFAFAPDGTKVGVSGFNKLPPREVKKCGWLRYVDGGEPDHDPVTHEVIGTGYNVTFDYVERLYEVRPRSPYLTVEPRVIKADDSDAVIVTYVNAQEDAPTKVTFTVNGATQDVELADGRAALSVSTAFPGPVDVSVDVLPGTLVTITATEA